jgi:transposase
MTIKMTQKRSVGIDISKDTFTACVCTREPGNDLHFSAVSNFRNDKAGFNQFIKWVRKANKSLHGVNFLMEATGVYYESLAFHLDKLDFEVNVVLPNTSKHYFQSLNIKTKTDKLDAKVLSQFAVERKHSRWHRPKPIYLELRNLTRFYVQLQEQKTAFSNLKHSKEEAAEVQGFILGLNQKTIQHLDQQIDKVRAEIERVCQKDSELWAKIQDLLTIKGLGVITIATIIAETSGFEKVKSAKQLASYAGYDIIQRESGTSVKGKTRISKKGNRYIRKALYFPAMVACRHNEHMKENYVRIIKGKDSKMVGQVAIQRKLLLLQYTLWKNNTTFDIGHKSKVALTTGVEATRDSN